jgi:hypothetical protein
MLTRSGWAFVASATLFLLLFATLPAEANARFCRQIEAELAALDRGGGGAASPRFTRALDAQEDEIRRVRAMQRRLGCGLLGMGSPQCGDLSVTLERMRRNLAEIERRAGRGDERSTTRERRRLEAALRANRCRDIEAREARRAPLGGVILRGGRDMREAASTAPGVRILPDPRTAAYGEVQNLRTYCVRLCDGYFFPMSVATTDFDLARDEERCAAACPGTEIRLFSRRAGDADAADMVSATGEPYSGLPNAFRFREPDFRRPQGCGCNATAAGPRGFSVVAGERTGQEPDAASAPAEPFVPLPSPRPDPAADPETLANRDGSFDAEAIRRLVRKPAGDTETAAQEGRRIRVVGPTFLPDPAEAEDRPVPGPTNVR